MARPIVAALAMGLLSCATGAAAAQDLSSCVAARLAQLRQTQRELFATEAVLVCPPAEAAQAAGQPGPRREMLYHWDPPPGWTVDPASVRVAVRASDGGSHEAPYMEGGRVYVRVWCEGRPAGSPEAMHSIVLEGMASPTSEPASSAVLVELENDCRAIGAR